jgi:hypothetical protein
MFLKFQFSFIFKTILNNKKAINYKNNSIQKPCNLIQYLLWKLKIANKYKTQNFNEQKELQM